MALTFNIIYDSSVNGAPAGFKTAINAVTQFFSSHFTDAITININVGYGEIGGQALESGAIGENLSYLANYSYAQLRSALATDARSADDATAVSTLPVNAPVSGNYWATQAEAKALGLAGPSSSIDAYAGFSNAYGFDYDNSNGVTAGQYDFFGVVAHEFSEVMGRTLLTGDTVYGSYLQTYPNSYVPLDLFHYSASGTRDFTATQPGYFSINGGTTNLHNFNTNPYGDAGDWAYGGGLDAGNAFDTTGVTEPFGSADLTALDVIGWNLNHAPVVSASSVAASRGQAFAAASLFSTSDADNDTIIRYEFADGTADPASGHFVLNGVVQSANQVIDVAAANLAQLSFQTGAGSDFVAARAFDGLLWGDWTFFNVNAPIDHAPVVTAAVVGTHGQSTFAASSLFTVTDADGDTITQYEFADGTADSTSGHFVVNGTVEPANQVIDVSAAQLAQTSFQTGSVSDFLGVRAFDGVAWSSWTFFNIDPIDHTPIVTAAAVTATHGQSAFAASSLFTVTDADGDTITQYEFADGTSDSSSGHFVVNGTVEPANQVIDVSAAQLAQTSFQTGSVSDYLGVRAFDGIAWGSWTFFTANAAPNHLPVVTAPDATATHGQSFAASSLFSVTDADGDAITQYEFADGTPDSLSGHFVVNGTVESANQVIDVSAVQLAQTSFQSGSVSDFLGIRAFDGLSWSAWSFLHVNAPANHAPVVTAATVTASPGQSFAASSLFAATDADGDAITQYEFADGTADPTSGHFVVNGTTQPANQVIDVSAAQLAQTSFQSGSGDVLGVRAFDGFDWSAWTIFNVNTNDHAPVASGGNASLALNTTVAASTLFTATDPDNDAVTKFEFADGNAAATSGHFAVNGVAQPANQVIDVLATDLNQATFVAGSAAGTDTLAVRASDGTLWSDWHFFTATSHA